MNHKSVAAGSFYPADRSSCKETIEHFKEKVKTSLRSDISAGIVPHAGWIFSGQIAFNVFSSIRSSPDMTFIILGAVHASNIYTSAIFGDEAWETPLGKAEVDINLCEEIADNSQGLAELNSRAHLYEHSIEVQVPFIQYLFPQAKIVPIMVVPDKNAVLLGKILAKLCRLSGSRKKIYVIGSSDLTHYGWNYDFAPFGIGQTGHDWVVKENDHRMIEMILKGDPDKIIKEAHVNKNACGAGAIGGTAAFARTLGIKEGELLLYTTSCDVMPEYGNTSFVGYAGIVF
ncbi:AmmeMemoRadiSam system protein B [Candidatus Desantisbacteria bacterium]|nr:AmmeMemoRadiSam system protein B [Candidatus Desantisbacteria bacterium]